MVKALKAVKIKPLVKLDLGCGKNKQPGFIGVDRIKFDGVDVVTDLQRDPWPWGCNTVSEVHSSHFVEHLDAPGRIHFVNELYRVLVEGGKATIVVPHWCSNRAYGDLTHCWPPVSEMWFYYLSKEWRLANAPHNDSEYNVGGYKCNFQATWGYGMRQDLMVRNQEYQTFALNNFKEAALDLHASLVKA